MNHRQRERTDRVRPARARVSIKGLTEGFDENPYLPSVGYLHIFIRCMPRFRLGPVRVSGGLPMSNTRRSDTKPYTAFRADRFFKEGDKWFFCTREGTIEGPFELRREAEARLADYVKILNSGFMPSDCELSRATLVPLSSAV